ncbi:hypothetical protein F01_140228 [Burkholderia cenocepacia]|nr:hypothetical protein F01_140228 [Burkholderia cenocepacia]
MAVAVHAASAHHRFDSRGDRQRAGRQARAHRRENERAARAIGDRCVVRSVAGRRQGRPDRARRLRAEARRAGAVGKHHGALDRRPLPRTPPDLLFPRRRRRGRLPVERRLDGPQPVPPRRSRVPDPRSQTQAARDRRGAVGVPRRQPVGMADAQRRPLSPAPRGQDDSQRATRAAREVLFVSRRCDAGDVLHRHEKSSPRAAFLTPERDAIMLRRRPAGSR